MLRDRSSGASSVRGSITWRNGAMEELTHWERLCNEPTQQMQVDLHHGLFFRWHNHNPSCFPADPMDPAVLVELVGLWEPPIGVLPQK